MRGSFYRGVISFVNSNHFRNSSVTESLLKGLKDHTVRFLLLQILIGVFETWFYSTLIAARELPSEEMRQEENNTLAVAKIMATSAGWSEQEILKYEVHRYVVFVVNSLMNRIKNHKSNTQS